MDDQRDREAEHQNTDLSELISAFPILMAQLDTRYQIRFASEGYRHWFGVDPDALVGHHIREVIGRRAFTTLKPRFDTALSGTQASYYGEVEYAHCGTRFIHGIYVPHFSYHGAVTGLQIVVSDVTEHRAVRKQLADETLLNQTIIQHAIDGIVTINADGIIQSFNPAAERLFGYPAAEVIGRNVNILMPDWQRRRHDDYIRNYQRTREPRIIGQSREVTAQHRNGSPIDIRLAVAEFYLNRQQHFVGFIHDVSERKRAEREARQALDELAHADRISAMGEMAAGLAHETSQPLTAIHATAEACRSLLESGNTDPERLREAMDQIALQSRRASNIIQELRSFVRKGEPEDVSRHNPEDLIANVLPLLRTEIDRANVAVEVVPETPLCHCPVNRIQIEQVLVNLIRNAVDALSEHEGERRLRIRSRVREEDGMCEIDVEDTGPGIPQHHLQRLFDPFFTTKTQGMGQGLPICKSLVERHGGSLDVESTDSGGTLFRFTLPHDPQCSTGQGDE